MRTIAIKVQGQRYLWNGSTWTDERFLRPPAKVRGQLTGRLIAQLKRAPLKKLDVELVLRVAHACADEACLEDAQKLAARALKAHPKNAAAAVALASLLRRQRLPRQAIKVTDPFTRRRSAELLTVRAAAFCDISEWDEAEKLVRRAIAIDKTEVSPETMQVMARVVSARARSAA